MYYVLIPPLLTALICSTESTGERELKALLSSTRLCLLHQRDSHRVCASTGAKNNRNNINSTGARSRLQNRSCTCPNGRNSPGTSTELGKESSKRSFAAGFAAVPHAALPRQQQLPLSVLRDQEDLAAQEKQQLRAELIPHCTGLSFPSDLHTQQQCMVQSLLL